MAPEAKNALNANEQAAKAAIEAVQTGEQAGLAIGKTVASETTDRIESASKAYGAAIEATLKAVQDYNTKLVQVLQTNAEANLQLGRTLMQIRSPTDLVEAMGRTVRERTELVAGQTKVLAALRQEATRRAIEMISAGR